MAVLEQWGMPLAVVGMMVAMLFMAAVVNRYQTHQAVVRATVRRLEAGLGTIVPALAGLQGVPLSRELRVTLRSEVLARYQKIRRVYRRYPGIAEKIRAAEAALQAERATPSTGVGPIESDQTFRRMVAALEELLAVIGQGQTVQPVPPDVRANFCRELGERRAEVMSRFHLVEARRQESAGNLSKARIHLTTLLQALRQRGPGTEFVRELYGAAEAALDALSERQLGVG